jgi:hypothetical protein
MVACPPETRIPPTAAGRFLRCRPALNPQKKVFSIKIHPSAPGDNVLSQKLLVDVGVYQGSINPLDLLLILLASPLSTFLL